MEYKYKIKYKLIDVDFINSNNFFQFLLLIVISKTVLLSEKIEFDFQGAFKIEGNRNFI